MPQSLFQDLLNHAQTEKPLECVGWLAGIIVPGQPSRGLVLGRYPMLNAARSPVLFNVDPREILAATKDLGRREWSLLAIYHSHPSSDPVPSKTDLASHQYPDSVCLIVSLKGDQPLVRAWWLAEDSYQEAEWEVLPE